jgi:lysozyme
VKTNRAGLDLIKKFESLSLVPYAAPEQAGTDRRTIGYGHVILDSDDLPDPMTEEQADELLQKDLERFEKAVWNAVETYLTSNQFSALVCFVFNVGGTAFENSTLLRQINAQNFLAVAPEFDRWNRATVNRKLVALAGLTARRTAERKLFETEKEIA